MVTVLSDQEIFRLSREAFGDLGSEPVVIFGAICLAESGGNTEAVLDNVAAGYQPPGSPYQYDRGLPQINSIHGYDAARLLSDPAYACWCARQIYNLQSFRAWSTFNGGQYQAFLSRIAAAKMAVEAEETAAVAPDEFQRGKKEGRSEMFFAGWERDTVPVLREVARMLSEHADWIEQRPSEWGIQGGP